MPPIESQSGRSSSAERLNQLQPRDAVDSAWHAVKAAAPATSDEFAAGASEWPTDLSRRRFLEITGATLALAGLAGCNRQPDKTIVPYVTPPDRDALDATLVYATTMPWEGYGRGVLVRANSGRPTKIDGNPAHPDSLGASDLLMQASILDLYDPDRTQSPQRRGSPTSWLIFEDAWRDRRRELTATKGRGLALITEPTTSDTLLRAVHHLLDRFPQARWYQHTPLPRHDRDGELDDYDFAKADVVLAIDADFLFSHPASLRYARAFAQRRRFEHGKVRPNRLYALEPVPSITGSMADHRLATSPARQRELLAALGAALEGQAAPSGHLTAAERQFVARVAADLREHAPNVVCVAGERAAPEIRDWAVAVNARLRANGVTRHALPATRSDADPRAAGDLAAFIASARAGDVDTVVIASTNPAYTAPRAHDFAAAMQKVAHRIHLGSHRDETAMLCEWHLPESHYLESWSDLRAYDGTASLVQPLIAPLYASRGAAELIFFLADGLTRADYDLVRETWQSQRHAPQDFEAAWRGWLNSGVIAGTANARRPGAGPKSDAAGLALAAPAPADRGAAEPHGKTTRPAAAQELTLVLRPDPHVRDGRWANNGWLQELPKPLTKLVWDNPVLISPALARERGWQNGDIIAVRTKVATIDVPVWISPGVANDCLIAFLGYGRTHAGAVGTGLGFDAYGWRSANDVWATAIDGVSRRDGHAVLVSTHAHFSMEGRDLVRTVDASSPPPALGDDTPPPSLYSDVKYDGYRWGMLIDLAACIGCQACVVACQAENNTPIVGKDQVARGREMHWLRVDRYFAGDADNPDVLHQPVPCMQCETAPCEVVCPTAATVHSSEGLNDMVYNRCIGTRYCSNNCPYKVRRFNFLDYREPKGSSLYLQKNPDVTVRSRGVMEKCTYCVQRIDTARIAAERGDRRIADGEVRTACQEACPTEAIVFGDLNDPKSKVRARKAEPTHYVLLEELNTRPRTTYLARTMNKRKPPSSAETSDSARTSPPAAAVSTA